MLERKGTAVINPDSNFPFINMILTLIKIFPFPS